MFIVAGVDKHLVPEWWSLKSMDLPDPTTHEELIGAYHI